MSVLFVSRDGIIGHKFEKRLESFAPCYSQSLALVDFTENQAPYKKIREPRKLESEKPQVYAQKPRLKLHFKNSISGPIK